LRTGWSRLTVAADTGPSDERLDAGLSRDEQ
jgi:hypothetical protein